MYLLDTNIISELRRPRPHGAVLAWLQGVLDVDLHVSAVSVGELQVGIERTRDQDPSKAAAIEVWVDTLATKFDIIAIDARIFRCWARLMHRQSDRLVEDAMIAATAEIHRLTVVTRNVRDFARLGTATLNPFDPH